MHISIIGAGTWGTALATVLNHNKHSVRVWHRNPEFVNTISKTRKHPNFKNETIDSDILFTSDLNQLKDHNALIIAIPCQTIRGVLSNYNFANHSGPIINTSKGIENSTNLLIHNLLSETSRLPNNDITVLSGPSHAEEVMQRKATTVVTACQNIDTARTIRDIFANEYFRVYSSDDIIGVEIAGAIKNVISIASGICTGLQLGDNTQAALLTRGLEEIKRLGVAMGADKNTFSGLTGLGDLIVTSFSKFSRNRYVGECLGKGINLKEILKAMDMVAEGITTTKSVIALRDTYNIEMPISSEIYNVLFNNKSAKEAIHDLMNRNLVDEHY